MSSTAKRPQAQMFDWAELVANLDIGSETDWPPALLDHSAWLEHVPFAHWLIKTLHPASLVELGTYTGVSYGAFCGSVARLGYTTRCYAIDTWVGDEHAGLYGHDVYTKLKAINDAEWGAFSTLLRLTFAEARHQFAPGEIDLLHIDGLHTYEAVRADWESWRDTLSDRGIVLFHDTEVRENDFGVWRLFDELKAQYPYFKFLHGYGLGVLGVGTDLPAPISALFDATANTFATASIQSYFAARGATVRESYLLRETTRRAERAESDLHAVSGDNETLKEALGNAESHLLSVSSAKESLEEALSNAMRRANRAEDMLRTVSQRTGKLEAALAATKAELTDLHRSRSWRLTRPLRAAGRTIRYYAAMFGRGTD